MKTLLPLALLALAALSSAQTTVYRYSQNLAGLALATPGLSLDGRTLHLGFQLSDGSQAGNGSTTVTISNLRLTGGTFGAPVPDIGNVNRSNGNIVLRDTASTVNGLADATTPFSVPVGSNPSLLEFDFSVVTTALDTPIPDYFTISMLLDDLSSINTTGNVGSETVGFRIANGETPQIFTISSDYSDARTAMGDPRFANLASPTITTAVVPEPASMAALGLGALALMRRRKRN